MPKTKVKFFAPFVAAAFAAALAAPALAASAGDIVYVDLDRVYLDSKVINAVREEIDVEFRDREEELKKTREKILKMEEELEKEALALSEGDRESRERMIVATERNFARDRRALSEDLGLRFQERRRIIDREIFRIINELVKERKYRMVLNPHVVIPIPGGERPLTQNLLLHADEDADITDEVVALFDKQAKIDG